MANTIDSFITQFPVDVQRLLRQLEATIKQAAPLAEEGFGYGVPGFKLNGKQLVNFSAFKNHIGLYPTPSAIEKFKNELSVYKTSKGAIQFPFDKPIPYDLVKRIVEYRVKVLSG
jgi:uncharacterized protein YdhG (YjbR/CyaY superfamily)